MPIQPKQQPPYYNSKGKIQIYTSLLTQVTTSNPTIITLENTIGDITITRNDPGDYRSTETFDPNKTTVIISQTDRIYSRSLAYAYIREDDGLLYISTIDTATGNSVDDVLSYTTLQIIIYP